MSRRTAFWRPPDSRVATFKIPAHYAAGLLSGRAKLVNLPKDTTIFDVREADAAYGPGIWVFAHSKEFPEVADGNMCTTFIAEYEPVKVDS